MHLNGLVTSGYLWLRSAKWMMHTWIFWWSRHLMMQKRTVPPVCLAVKDQSGKTWVWSFRKDLCLQCAWPSMTNQERPESDDVEKICACKGHNGTFYSLTTDLHSHLQLLHQDGFILNSSTLLLLDVCTQQSSHHCKPLTKFCIKDKPGTLGSSPYFLG